MSNRLFGTGRRSGFALITVIGWPGFVIFCFFLWLWFFVFWSPDYSSPKDFLFGKDFSPKKTLRVMTYSSFVNVFGPGVSDSKAI